MTVAWVLGSSGLLGSALCRVLDETGTELFCPEQRFAWSDSSRLSAQLTDAVQAFVRLSAKTERWEIYWAAGIGTMGSSAESLVQETEALSWLLRGLEARASQMPSPGTFALASSAGAIYAGATDEVITEETSPSPTTAYAAAKLRQEEMLRGFVHSAPGRSALVARISTLYGAGQARGKGQGLLSHMARSILRNQPIQIYVPYDTVRDYINAGDAATKVINAMRLRPAKSTFHVKIIASERPSTIAEIIAIFKRVARKNPRIVTSANRLSTLYVRRVQFRSVALPNTSATATQTLAVGISQMLLSERMAYARASGDAPPIATLCNRKDGRHLSEHLEIKNE